MRAFILALSSLLMVAASTEVTELKVDVTYMPKECPIKSQKGDVLSMHYVRRSRRSQLASNCWRLLRLELCTPMAANSTPGQ